VRRLAPAVLVAVGVAALLAWYVGYSRRIVRELRLEASRSSRMYARVYGGLSSPEDGAAAAALLDVSQHIREMGVPMILTDAAGRPTAAANLPFDEPIDGPRTRAYVAELDRQNPPVTEDSVGTVHFGHTPLVRGLQVIPLVQAAVLTVFLLGAFYALRTRGRAERERVWAGMARESAHQLGTPLSSLSGWMELLDERSEDSLVNTALIHMRDDLTRLDRVAHRFERIGRPPKRERVDACALAEGVASYFRMRAPTLAHAVTVSSACDGGPIHVDADPVLIEWALEVLCKNAIDALAGRGGMLRVSAGRTRAGQVRLRVSDDGPGVPREIRARIFEAGFSTKERGWGVGLSLARRIVEENHSGKLLLVPAERGATFDVILP
jgi:signal transduction histidine kinase